MLALLCSMVPLATCKIPVNDPNDLIVSPHGPLLRLEDSPIRTRWLANIYCRTKSGLPPIQGLHETDPILEKDKNEPWHPDASSPVIKVAEGEFTAATIKMQGNPRRIPQRCRLFSGADQRNPEPAAGANRPRLRLGEFGGFFSCQLSGRT
jgi:hypothetical protein